MELIDRQDAITAIDDMLMEDEQYKVWLKLSIKNIKPVDAVPVRHGTWIPVDSYSACGGDEVTWNAHGNPIAFHYCSECKNQAYANEFGEDILSSYCPNCGAKMGEEDE